MQIGSLSDAGNNISFLLYSNKFMLKLQKHEDTKWIMFSNRIYYRIINGILYIRFVYLEISVDALNKWKTVATLPFELDTTFDYQINNNFKYNSVVDVRIYQDGKINVASATETTIQLAGLITIPL